MLPVKLKKNFYVLTYFSLLGCLIFGLEVSAQKEQTRYILLEPSVLTGVDIPEDSTTDLMTYLKGAYQTMFVVVFSAAVIMIVWSGFEYMLTDVVTQKGIAKQRLQNAFWGLAIIALSYLILYIINPDLVKFSLDL